MVNNILIVDDEPEICLLLSAIMRQMGFKTHDANSLAKAKNLLNETEVEFSLAMIDVNLTDGIGLSLLPLLNERNIKTIVMSAYNSYDEQQNALAQGAAYFISKPFSRIQVMEAINKLKIEIPKVPN